ALPVVPAGGFVQSPCQTGTYLIPSRKLPWNLARIRSQLKTSLEVKSHVEDWTRPRDAADRDRRGPGGDAAGRNLLVQGAGRPGAGRDRGNDGDRHPRPGRPELQRPGETGSGPGSRGTWRSSRGDRKPRRRRLPAQPVAGRRTE